MISHINTDISFSPSLFNIAAKAFKNGIKDIANQILMELIFVLRKQNDELRFFYLEIQRKPDLINNIDLDEAYDFLQKNELKIKRLLDTAKDHKDKSDIFNQFYIAIEELYTTLSTVPVELGFLEVKIMREVRLLNAS